MPDEPKAYPLSQQVQPLAAFAPGQGAIITGFLGGRKLQERMVALGMFPGQRLMVCQNNGSSIVVRLNGNRLALGRGVSQKILATHSAYGCKEHHACLCPIKETETPT